MTYKELTDRVRREIFPSGEAENLIGVHDSFFNESFYDLAKLIPCLRFRNSDVYPACATYFSCGMTVLPQPPGKIIRVYVIDRIDPLTGKESATGEDDWCAKVDLQRVDFCFIERYVKLAQQCTGTNLSLAYDFLYAGLFGNWRHKRRWPKPTDEGYAALPSLPPEFHYPQTSTDAAGRSPMGVYATDGGRVWIAPWVQSTESIVLQWVGIKRSWNDSDLVEDDPKFRQAVRFHVAHQHEMSFGEPAKAAAFHAELFGGPNSPGVIPLLIHECEEQNRITSCAEDRTGSMARGFGGAASSLFYNDTKFEFTAFCPTGKTGGPFTVVKDIGTVPSALSVVDANLQAEAAAQTEANARLAACVTPGGPGGPAVVFLNEATPGIASCPGASADGLTPAATGNPSSITVIEPADLHSAGSQTAANALAKAAAEAKARALLRCTFHNAAQTRCVTCPSGAESCKTIPINQPQYDSTISQADANEKAGAAATSQAHLACVVVPGDSVTVSNVRIDEMFFFQCCGINPLNPLGITCVNVQARGVCAAHLFFESGLITKPGDLNPGDNQTRMQGRVNALARQAARYNAMPAANAVCATKGLINPTIT